MRLYCLCPFPHLNTLQSQGNLPTLPLPNARLLWAPCSECKGHLADIQRGSGLYTTVSCGLWVLSPPSVNIPGVLTEVGIHRKVENQGSNPGSATWSLMWPWTSDLTFSVPWFVQLNRSHKNLAYLFSEANLQGPNKIMDVKMCWQAVNSNHSEVLCLLVVFIKW